MNLRAKILVSLLSGLGIMGLSSLNASAAVVCNSDGDCWHAHEAYTYPPTAGVIVHPDDWKWRDGERFVWKEHPGRGYWHGSTWQAF